MAKWRVGLIGNGGICRGAHLAEYLEDDRIEVVALCDIIEEFGPVSDALVFCGDGICDICTYLQDAYEDENLQELLPPVVAIAKGNGDSEKNQIIKPKTLLKTEL